jgi:hypothetical protein
MWAPRRRTVGVLGGSTVLSFLLALGTFDVYLAALAQVLLVATIVTGAFAMLGTSRVRPHQH